MLARIKERIAAQKVVGGEAFSPAELALCERALREGDELKASSAIPLGVAFSLTVLAIMPFIIRRDLWLPVLIGCGFVGTLDSLWLLWLKRHVSAKWVVIAGNLVLVGLFSYVLAYAVENNREGAFVLGASALSMLASILTMLSPFSGRLTPAKATGYWLVTLAFFPARPETMKWMIVYAIGLAFSCLIRNNETIRRRRELVLEHRSREAEIRAAKVRFQRELELAREIQDSMAPPAHQATPDGVQVYCMQMKHEKVAGDWMTVRTCKDGSLVMMIADATGKGLQAALVVHAIQSLWATTLDSDGFDPKEWLERVNLALFRLGEKQTHSATIGVAVLNKGRITYWSAGHLPLFLLLGSARDVTFKTLNGRGNVLGLGSQLQLQQQYIDLAPNYPVRIIMASDGVLDRGTLTQHRELESLYSRVKTEGMTCLNDFDTHDDKTLIVVEKNYTVSAKAG